MSNIKTQNLNKLLFAELGICSNTVIPFSPYAKITGSERLALILYNLIYWSNKSTKYNDGSFYKTYAELSRDTGIPKRSLERLVQKLVDLGLVKKFRKKIKGAPTNHYVVIIEKVKELMSKVYTLLTTSDEEQEMKKSAEIHSRKVRDSIYTKSYSQNNNKADLQSARDFSSQDQKQKVIREGFLTDDKECKTHDHVKSNEPGVNDNTRPDTPGHHNNKKEKKGTPWWKRLRIWGSDYKKDEKFMKIYNVYKRKDQPREAYALFKQLELHLAPDDKINEIAIDVQRRYANTEKQYVPYPKNYFVNTTWENELPENAPTIKQIRPEFSQEEEEIISNYRYFTNCFIDRGDHSILARQKGDLEKAEEILKRKNRHDLLMSNRIKKKIAEIDQKNNKLEERWKTACYIAESLGKVSLSFSEFKARCEEKIDVWLLEYK